MVTTREYLESHGKPIAFYSDRHSVFHSSNKNAVEAKNPTQYGRILKELGIELICANSSQAKGRVERANLTLQNCLVKEMRLQGIIPSVKRIYGFPTSLKTSIDVLPKQLTTPKTCTVLLEKLRRN